MPLDWNELADLVIECVRCGHRFKGEEMIVLDRIVCPRCGFRVCRKVRPSIARRVKAI